MKRTKSVIPNRSSFSEKPLIPVEAGAEHCDPSHRFGPYCRRHYLLHYCISGKGTFETGGTVYSVAPGQIFIILPDTVTTYTADERDPWHYVWLGFIGGNSERLAELSPVVPYKADTFRRIADSVEESIENAELYASYAHEIFYTLFGKEHTQTDVCRHVRDEINISYMKNITVDSLARDTGLNRRYLSRIFKERYGVSLKEYLIGVRMRRAAELLEKGCSVSEAAYMTGYADAFNFSKMFHKIIGVPPSEYRKQSRKDSPC